MATKVGLCNSALIRLGANTVRDIDIPTTEEETLCNYLFDLVRDRVMAQGSWTSLIKRAELAQLTTAPLYGFLYAYQLPVDPYCIRILDINETQSGDNEYTREGNTILTDLAALQIRYIARITNVGDWDPLLCEAVEMLLTAYLAKKILGDDTVVARYMSEYRALIGNNLALDGKQGSTQLFVFDDFLGARL